MLDLGIDLNVWPWVWLGVAVVFALIELTILAGSFILLPWAISGFAAALLGFYEVPIEVQWAVFLFGGLALFLLFYRYARWFIGSHPMPLGVGADRLVGATGIVTKPVEPDDTTRAGRVSIDGEVWGALTEHRDTLAVGAKVRVLSVQGTRVIVEPIPTDAPADKGENT